MKFIILSFLMYAWVTVSSNAQNLELNNTNSKSMYPKLVINNGKTTLTTKSMITMTQTWNQVPVNFDNSDGRSRYKMVITEDFKDMATTYEIFWMHIRSTNRYTGHMKVLIRNKKSGHVTERSESYTGKLL